MPERSVGERERASCSIAEEILPEFIRQRVDVYVYSAFALPGDAERAIPLGAFLRPRGRGKPKGSTSLRIAFMREHLAAEVATVAAWMRLATPRARAAANRLAEYLATSPTIEPEWRDALGIPTGLPKTEYQKKVFKAFADRLRKYR